MAWEKALRTPLPAPCSRPHSQAGARPNLSPVLRFAAVFRAALCPFAPTRAALSQWPCPVAPEHAVTCRRPVAQLPVPGSPSLATSAPSPPRCLTRFIRPAARPKTEPHPGHSPQARHPPPIQPSGTPQPIRTHLRKEVLWSPEVETAAAWSAAAHPVLKPLLSILVIDLTLLGICKDLVGPYKREAGLAGL